MDNTNIMIEFSVFGDDFSPSLITDKLLIEPTESYLKGEKSKNNIERKETCWSLSSGYIENLYVSELFQEVVGKLQNKITILKKIKKQYNLTYKFFIVVRIEQKQAPSIYLDSNIIKFAQDIGAEFDFDLYIY